MYESYIRSMIHTLLSMNHTLNMYELYKFMSFEYFKFQFYKSMNHTYYLYDSYTFMYESYFKCMIHTYV